MYERDSTQLYYMRARWYDPRTKRFMTEDPIGLSGGINRYVFSENDPVNGRVLPDSRQPWFVVLKRGFGMGAM
jgi:uncharacterized protein RhaS with RHS repeats